MANLNPEAAFDSMKARVVAAVSKQFPYEGKRRRLELVEVQLQESSDLPSDPHHTDNVETQYHARTQGRTWGVPIKATLRLVDKQTGEELDKQIVTLARLPKLTRRYSYIVDGQERQHDSLFRSMPRPYHQITGAGKIEAKWNLARGLGFDLKYDPEKGHILMRVGTSNTPVFEILKALGVSEGQMRQAWGPVVFDANAQLSRPRDIDKLYKALGIRPTTRGRTPTHAEKIEQIRKYFDETEVWPEAMKSAFGKPYTSVNGENLLLSTKKLLAIQRGRTKESPPISEQPDDRQALSAKYLATTEDFIVEALDKKTGDIRRRVEDKIDNEGVGIGDILSPYAYNKVITGVFDHAQRPDQTNPLQFVSGYTRTTIRGGAYGGVSDPKINLDRDKLINPTHLGFLDPIQTPEQDVGIALHLPLGVQTERSEGITGKSRTSTGQRLKIRVYDKTTQGWVEATPADLEFDNVAYPDQVVWAKGKPRPVAPEVVCYDKERQTTRRPWSEVRYVLPSSKALFSFSANLIPFLQNDSGNRAMMAAKQQEQAVPLQYREAPLVQVKTDGDPTFEEAVGSFSSHRAPVSGKVTKVSSGMIHIRGEDGKTVKVPIYDHYPLSGGKGTIHAEPVVKQGQVVKKGDLLADTNFTKGGALSLGTNLRVAYVPWKGLNFEDGVVVSETAAKKMTSTHMHQESVTIYSGMIGGKPGDKARWVDYSVPERTTAERMDKLDETGVIKEGQEVEEGDVLVAVLTPTKEVREDEILRRIHKSLVRNYKDRALVWTHEYPGKVVKVVRTGRTTRTIAVHVRTQEPLVVGDKMAGRHGNKGIVSRIVSDDKMPRDKDGEPVHVLLSPAGVPSRMNVGQVLETAASKIAKKTGKPYVVENFIPGVDYTQKVKDDLRRHGLSDTEELFDPETGRSIGRVMTGDQYLLKLHHMVEKKQTARSYGGYTSSGAPPSGAGIPGGGQKLDMLTTYAMLAHGAKHNLREAFSFKSDGEQEEVWDAVMTGRPLPAPQPTRGMYNFLAYLRAMGVNTEKTGDRYILSPLTDKQALSVSNGEIPLPEKALYRKELVTTEEKKGLFDPKVTGGLDGPYWSHIELQARLPNPLFQPAIQELLGISKKEYAKLVSPELNEDGSSGFDTIVEGLKAIDVDKELAATRKAIPQLRESKLNAARRRLRYLEALKRNNLSPLDAYTNKILPVVPPKMRKVSIGLDGRQIYDDLNGLYLAVGHANMALKRADRSTPPEDVEKWKAHLYDATEGLRLTGMSLGKGRGQRHHVGLMERLTGKIQGKGQPKGSYFQSGVLARRQDLSGRSTIIPEPDMGLDEVGIPTPIALEMYRPFVIRELFREGTDPNTANKLIDKKTPRVMRALERAVAERPVLMKRDPALHKFSILAFKPKLIHGRAIAIHPLVVGGYNADFDGDQQLGTVFLVVPRAMFNADFGFWSPRRAEMAARFGELVGLLDSDDVLVTCDLSEFPRTELVRTKGHIEFWKVPDDIRVVGIDEATGEVGLFAVAYWSKHLDRVVEVVTLGSGRQIITDDDERAVFGIDADSLEWCRRRPREAFEQFVPVVDEAPLPERQLAALSGFVDATHYCWDTIKVDAEFGYLLGSLVGDGWVVHSLDVPKGVAFSSSYGDVQQRWEESLSSVFAQVPPISHDFSDEDKLKGSDGSWRAVVSSRRFGEFVAPLIGRGARDKHLPPFFLQASEQFCGGLLSGLWDTDGSFSWSTAKARPQFFASYTSTSIRLVQEIQYLLRTFKVDSRITASKTLKGGPSWILNVSTPDLYDALREGRLVLSPAHEDKRARLAEFMAGDPPSKSGAYSRYRLVPLPPALARDLRKHFQHKQYGSIYASLSKAVATLPRKYVSKQLALRIVQLVGDRCTHPLYTKWKGLVELDGVHFEAVKKVEYTKNKETGYDLTVPGADNFMAVDGVVLSNTMALFVPTTPEAVDEARGMMPSKNLFSPTHYGLMPVPGQDSLLGVYQATKWGSPVQVPPNITPEKVIEMMRDGKLKPSDVVAVGGKLTTPGRLMLAASLPPGMRNDETLLHDPKFRLNKKKMKAYLKGLAKKEPVNFAKTVNAWKDHGNRVSYLSGSSFGLDDFHDGARFRDRLLAKYKREEAAIRKSGLSRKQKNKKVIALYERAGEELKNYGEARYRRMGTNRVFEWTDSGSRGSWDQFRQLVFGPMLVTDAAKKKVPVPITKSYGEGLSVSEYWASMHGARKGALDRVAGTSEPGALTKDIINTVMDYRVTSEDCGTSKGTALRPDDLDAADRYLAQPVKLKGDEIPAGTLLTPAILTRVKNSGVGKVIVRSPLHCRMGKGVCAKCLGLNEKGKEHAIGTNVGVIAGHALGEPVTQLTMRTFHTGGAAGTGQVVDAFQRAKQLFTVPENLPDKATLSTVSGQVERVAKDPRGGSTVTIAGKEHRVVTGQVLKHIKPGYSVAKGEEISTGPIDPHDLLAQTKNLGKVRAYLADEIDKAYGGMTRRRNIETVVRAMTNLTRVTSAPEDSTLVRGELAPLSAVEAYNAEAREAGRGTIRHKPQLAAMNTLPLAGQEDWMARLNYQRLKETYQEGAAQGWSSDIHGHPIPGLAHGAEFGLREFEPLKPPPLSAASK